MSGEVSLRKPAARFQLGYDSAIDCVVLPCDGGHIVRRAVAEKRYLNEKGLPSPLFQADKLTGSQPVFVVEGVFDALSAEELGFRACAMNGSGQPNENRGHSANAFGQRADTAAAG